MMSFEFPDIHHFPPFFTKQPNQETWAKQKQIWGDLVLNYCHFHRIFQIELNQVVRLDLFKNDSIQRKLSLDVIQILLEDLVQRENAEWISKSKDKCIIWYKKPREWADLIEKWVNDSGMKGSVFTMYELIHGDSSVGQEFHGCDEKIIVRAIEMLNKKSVAQLFTVGSESEYGIKFF